MSLILIISMIAGFNNIQEDIQLDEKVAVKEKGYFILNKDLPNLMGL